MKIVHVVFHPYNDYWGYQENLLPKYQIKLGHEVTVITTNTELVDGKTKEIAEKTYFLNDGTKIIRIKHPHGNNPLIKRLNYYPIYKILVEEKPNLIMMHGLVSISIGQAVKYIRQCNKNCKLVLDNHQDDTISRINSSILGKSMGIFYKYYHRIKQKNYYKVYGVTPWRVDFARDVFGIKEEKLDLLLMGADDFEIEFGNSVEIREKMRTKYNINNDDFVFVTGGKLDENKKIIETLKAFRGLENPNIKLLIFGSVHNDIKIEFNELIHSDSRIIYTGFIRAEEMYNYFFASDCAVFPGQHSVIWEQAVAAGIPAIFRKYVDGYVDIGGNCILLNSVSEQTIQNAMKQVTNSSKKYQLMKKNAISTRREKFFYSKIAKKSIS